VSSLFVIVPLVLMMLFNLCCKRTVNSVASWLTGLYFIIQSFVCIFWTRFSISSELFPMFNFEVDKLGLLMMLTISIVALSSMFVGLSTISESRAKFNFLNLLLISTAGMNGVVMVRDIFSLYVFLEVTAVSSFILIALNRDNKHSLEGSFKYFIMSAVATVMMLSSIALLFIYSGNTSFTSIRDGVQGVNSFYVVIAVALFMCGLFIKGGLIPFHGWLPDAYSSAPAGVSVLLAGIVTKTTGIYTMIRIVSEVFGFNETIKSILLLIGIISIFVGAFAALLQTDFKRMLAYSSISQVGYIVLALGTGTALGIAGAVFHLFNHSIFKSQLFVNSAAVEKQTGTTNMGSFGGLATPMPVTGWTSVVALLSTAGIPPLSGFWSKLIIIIALWTAGLKIYAALAIIGSLITLAYFLYMQRRVFFGNPSDQSSKIKEASIGLLLPAIILTLITIGIGIFFPYLIDTIIIPVSKVF
jgi:proton-translocating NADH-quinone oxidoreductase chain N